MYGLKINRLYLQEILDGRKTCDMHPFYTAHRGRIALLDNQFSKIYGTAELYRVDAASYKEYYSWQTTLRYQIPEDPAGDTKKYYAYQLRNPVRFAKPLSVEVHPIRSVWVYIEDEKVGRATVQNTLADFD